MFKKRLYRQKNVKRVTNYIIMLQSIRKLKIGLKITETQIISNLIHLGLIGERIKRVNDQFYNDRIVKFL